MDSASQKGVFIPNDILDLTDLSDQEKMVLAQICYRARHNGGVCTDTNDQLAAVTRHHPNSIARAITTLEDIGTLTRGRIGRDRTLTPTTVLVMAIDSMDSASFPTASYAPPLGLYAASSLNNLLQQPSPSVNVGLTNCEPSTLTNGVGSLHNLLNQPQQLVNGALTKGEATLIIKRNIKLKKIKKGARAATKPSIKPPAKNEPKQIVTPPVEPQAVTQPPQTPPPAAPTPPTPSPPVPVPGRYDRFTARSQAEACNVPFSVWYKLFDYTWNESILWPLWLALTDEDRLKAIEHTKAYVASTLGKRKRFRANPERYLTEGIFHHEIITRTSTTQPTSHDYRNSNSRKLATVTEDEFYGTSAEPAYPDHFGAHSAGQGLGAVSFSQYEDLSLDLE